MPRPTAFPRSRTRQSPIRPRRPDDKKPQGGLARRGVDQFAQAALGVGRRADEKVRMGVSARDISFSSNGQKRNAGRRLWPRFDGEKMLGAPKRRPRRRPADRKRLSGAFWTPPRHPLFEGSPSQHGGRMRRHQGSSLKNFCRCRAPKGQGQGEHCRMAPDLLRGGLLGAVRTFISKTSAVGSALSAVMRSFAGFRKTHRWKGCQIIA